MKAKYFAVKANQQQIMANLIEIGKSLTMVQGTH